MKKAVLFKKLFIFAFALALLFSSAVETASATTGNKRIRINYQNLTIEINGLKIITKNAEGNVVFPFVYADRTYLPVRALANALGCSVAWDDSSKTVSISSSGQTAPQYGKPSRRDYSEYVTVEYANIAVLLDGVKLAVANEPFILNGSTYLPVREIADALHCTVSYNEKENIVGINYKIGETAPSGAASAAGSAQAAGRTPASGATPGATPAPDAASASGKQPSATGGVSPSGSPSASNAASSNDKASASNAASPNDQASASNVASLNDKAPASDRQSPAGAPRASVNETAAVAFNSGDLTFYIGEKQIRLDDNISVIRDALGKPVDYDEIESCAYDGLDKFYAFKGVEVNTLPINGDSICSIDAFDDTVKTSKNITVGSALAQIEAAYGKDHTYENGVLIYWDGPKGNPKTPQLYFLIGGSDKVESFGMYNGKSAG